MKAKQDFTIITIPGATDKQLKQFKRTFDSLRKTPDFSPIITNADTKVFKIKKGEMFKIVASEEKFCDIKDYSAEYDALVSGGDE